LHDLAGESSDEERTPKKRKEKAKKGQKRKRKAKANKGQQRKRTKKELN